MSGNEDRVETNELQRMIARLEELEHRDQEVWNEKRRLEASIRTLKREGLVENQLLSNFIWTLKAQRDNFGETVYIEADEDSVDRYMTELTYHLGDWGIADSLYIFSDGQRMEYYFNRDDAVLNIKIHLRNRNVQDYLNAFAELGIIISLTEIDEYIAGLRGKANQLEELIRVFR